MSELKADKTFVFGEECEAYKKSEADKVIAEKDEKIDELEERIDELQKATDSAWSKVNAMYDELRHHKYKRCLAMLEVAKLQRSKLTPKHAWWEVERARIKDERIKKLLKLAEKFKEVK